MQALQRTLQRIGKQLATLPLSARLFVGSAMVILLMALLLVSLYAGRSRMAPLGLPSTPEVRAAAARHLERSQIPYEDRGDDLYVPVDRRFAVLGELGESQVVAANELDFNALVDLNSNPFIGREQQRNLLLTAKMNVVSAMISARPDVARARVIIGEPAGAGGIGRANVASTAVVTVEMRGAPLTQELADSFGRTVAASHAGLKVENVTVTDILAGRSFVPRSGDDMAGGMYLELKQRTETYYRNRIASALAHVPGAVVEVNAVIKNTRERSSIKTVDDPKIGPRSSESRELSTSSSTRATDPGLRPNVGQAISAGGTGSETSETESREQLEPRFGGEDRIVDDATGYPLQVNAVVGIPRSFLVRLHQQATGDTTTEPDAAQLAAIEQRETERWRAFITPLIATGGLEGAIAGTVTVNMFHDFNGAGGASAATAALAGLSDGEVGGLLGGSMMKNIGLVVLAFASLLMMFLMVRRANVREALPTAQELVGIPPALQAAESEIVGEAEEGAAALEGVELDDSALRTQQILTQIEDMVKSTPDDAATLFERWVSQND